MTRTSPDERVGIVGLSENVNRVLTTLETSSPQSLKELLSIIQTHEPELNLFELHQRLDLLREFGFLNRSTRFIDEREILLY